MRRLLEDQRAISRLTATYASSGAVTASVATGTLFAANSTIENQTTGEVLLVNSVSSNDLSILSEGRAYRGSTAAAGSTNDLIVRDPRFTKDNIVEAINVVLSNWLTWYAPRLVWDSSTGGTFSSTSRLIACPADSYRIERVCFQADGITDLVDVSHEQLRTYPTTIVSTGFAVRASYGKQVLARPWFRHAGSPIGKTVHLLVGKRWAALETDAAEVPSDFPADADDLLVSGAALYLSGWRTMPRITPVETLMSRELNTEVPSIQSIQSQQLAARAWAERAAQVAGARPEASKPGKIWVP